MQEVTSLVGSVLLDKFIISGGERKVPGLFLEHPHYLDGVAISICTEGHAKVKIALREYELSPGMMAIIIPDLIVEPVERSENLSLKTIFFSYDFISELQLPTGFNIIEKITVTPCFGLSAEVYENILKYYSFIAGQYERDIPKYKSGIIKCLLFALIGEVCSQYSILESNFALNNRADKITNKFIELLLKSYKTEHRVSYYADRLNISPKYLMTLIKQTTGKSISTWINNALIAHSKRELKSTDKSICLISDELAFSSASQFCRFFKQLTGQTPLEYRNTDKNVILK